VKVIAAIAAMMSVFLQLNTNVGQTALVTFSMSVKDQNGQPILDLAKESFQITEDKKVQSVTIFQTLDLPMSVGLVVDDSGSMRNKRQRLNSAVLSLVTQSNPENETFLVSFGNSANLEQGFTSSVGNIMDALDRLQSRGQSALFDAIQLSLDKLLKDGKKEARALVLLSDGEDNGSRYKQEDVLKRLKESTVPIYIVGLLDEDSRRPGLFTPKPSSKARQMLQEFADVTGGDAYFPKSLDEIDSLCKRIASDWRHRYVIGYRSTNEARDGAWRAVRITIPTKPSFSVRTRTGYYGPR